MPYTPPASNAVYFDDASTSYTPPASGAVNFEDGTPALDIPVTTLTLTGIAPSIFRSREITIPVSVIALSGVAPSLVQRAISTTPAATGALNHRTLLGGMVSEGYGGHRMVFGGIAQEGVRAGHRTVIGGMGKEGPLSSGGGGADFVLEPPYASLVLSGNPPSIASSLPPVHADVRLWVRFLSNDPMDWSSYATPYVQTSGTLASNRFQIYDSTDPPTNAAQQLVYGGTSTPNLDYDGSSGWTIESFITYNHSENNTDPGAIFQWRYGSPYASFYQAISMYANAGDVKWDDPGFGNLAGPTSSHPLTASTKLHIAWCRNAGSGSQNEYLYVNGVMVLSVTGYSISATTPSGIGQFYIGGQVATNGGGSHTIDYYLHETRIVSRALYPSGTTFTPPTEGHLSTIS